MVATKKGGGGGGEGAGKVAKKAPAKEKKERAKSAWNFFSAETRATVASDLGADATFAEVNKELGKRWKELSKDGRAPYDEQAAADKARVENAANGASSASGASSARKDGFEGLGA